MKVMAFIGILLNLQIAHSEDCFSKIGLSVETLEKINRKKYVEIVNVIADPTGSIHQVHIKSSRGNVEESLEHGFFVRLDNNDLNQCEIIHIEKFY